VTRAADPTHDDHTAETIGLRPIPETAIDKREKVSIGSQSEPGWQTLSTTFSKSVRWPRGDPAPSHDHRRRPRRGGLDRHRLQSDQRPLRRRPADRRPGPRGDPRPGLRVQPRRPEPALTPHRSDRHPRRRVRAVQHRAAQGRLRGRAGQRLPAARLFRRGQSRVAGRLGAAVAVPAERDLDRRGDPCHPDHRGRRLPDPRRRHRPAHRAHRPADGGVGQSGRGPGRRAAPDRPRAPPDRLPRRPPRPGVGPAPRGGIPSDDGRRRPARRAGPGAVRRVPDGDQRRPGARPARPSGPADGGLRSQRPDGDPGDAVAQSSGLRIPDDLSVIGFDNIPEAAAATPGLTTIAQPLQSIGQTAMQLLLALLRGEEPRARHVQLATELVVRESTAPPSR